MDRSEIDAILQPIHEIEQREGRFILRKEIHNHLPEDLDFASKRILIRAWQASYFQRLRHIGIFCEYRKGKENEHR